MDYKTLEELNKLRQSGALTDEEFKSEKQKLFEESSAQTPPPMPQVPLPFGLQESSYLGLMSFLMFVPYIGWMLPIILWIMGKECSTPVNKQGQYILNWYITWFIGGIILAICFFATIPVSFFFQNPIAVVGGVAWVLPVVIILCILSLIFPIIGGIKGLNGQAWKYPLSIPFLK